MHIHYLSCHATLEYDEVKLLTELGHDVFSNGVYRDPKGHPQLPRPSIEGAPYYPEYDKLAIDHPKTNLPRELIDPFDVFIIMHVPEWVTENWDKIRHKRVIWRSIGQSTPRIENAIRRMRYEGLRLVRYSPMEQNIPDYLGHDAIIRFYKEPEQFGNWVGSDRLVINITQSLKGRGIFCHYDHIMQILEGFPAKIYGPGNDDLGPLNGGEISFDNIKGRLRESRVFLYAGTWPAPYTLAFVEAMMTGIPVVSIGSKLAEDLEVDTKMKFFEIPSIIENGVNGFYSDDINELRSYIHQLLEDHTLAKKIGDAGRARAIEVFGKRSVKKHWGDFLR